MTELLRYVRIAELFRCAGGCFGGIASHFCGRDGGIPRFDLSEKEPSAGILRWESPALPGTPLPQDDGEDGWGTLLFLPSYSGWGDVVFDYGVEVEAARFLQWGWGAVVEQVPGFAVVFPLGLFVAGADSDGVFAGGDLGRDYVPDIFGDAVDGQVVKVGRLVAAVGAVHVEEAGYEVSGLQVAGLEERRFDLDADEARAQIEDYVVLGGVAQRLGQLEASFDGFGHETKLGPLASLFVAADVHAGGFHFVLCANRKGAAGGPRLIFVSISRLAFSRG